MVELYLVPNRVPFGQQCMTIGQVASSVPHLTHSSARNALNLFFKKIISFSINFILFNKNKFSSIYLIRKFKIKHN